MDVIVQALQKIRSANALFYTNLCGKAKQILTDTSGQGTTEYAILVGVLVVIAIFSIIAFKGKIQELWDSIASGISAL